MSRMNLITVALVAATVTLAGCSDFVERARQDGITITDPVGARFTADRICSNMDKGARVPADVLTSLPGGGTADELELARRGVAERCPEHNEVYAGVVRVINDAMAATERIADEYHSRDPNYNVGPDGYCTATPCGSRGKLPGGYQP